MDQTKGAQIMKLLVFAVTLANCGSEAAGDSSALARAADFLPLLEDLPGLASLNGAELKAEWAGMSTADREALVASAAAGLSLGTDKLNASVEVFVEVGFDLLAAIAKGVAAAEALKA